MRSREPIERSVESQCGSPFKALTNHGIVTEWFRHEGKAVLLVSLVPSCPDSVMRNRTGGSLIHF